MKKWTEVRRSVLIDKMSKRQACKTYELHWDTLEKILASPEPPKERKKTDREKPVIGPYLPIIHAILESDKKAPKKQRHTAKRIFERLRDEEGYQGQITVVQDAVRAWKQKQQEPFLPLSHKPGEAQFDFGEAKVIYRGRERKAAFFVMSLPHSDAFFCQAFPRECTETFQEGHKRAFQFFDGIPYRISYDNSKIAVARIVGRRGETPTKELLRLESHYLFNHHFCLVRRPNEKGHTESLVGFARRNFMVPVPQFDDFETFNQDLAEACLKDLERKLRGTRGTKRELLVEDQAAMLPLPPDQFEARRLETRKATSLSLVRFDCNDYSVPTAYAYHPVTVVGGIDRVRFLVHDRVVAEHVRDWERENVHYNPLHYLALLERKPNGLDFGKPFEDWDLPLSFDLIRRRLEGSLGSEGRREFIKILRLLEKHSVRELAAALDRALEIGAMTVDAVQVLVQEGREVPAKIFSLDGRPHLQGHDVPAPKLSNYDKLRVREGGVS